MYGVNFQYILPMYLLWNLLAIIQATPESPQETQLVDQPEQGSEAVVEEFSFEELKALYLASLLEKQATAQRTEGREADFISKVRKGFDPDSNPEFLSFCGGMWPSGFLVSGSWSSEFGAPDGLQSYYGVLLLTVGLDPDRGLNLDRESDSSPDIDPRIF